MVDTPDMASRKGEEGARIPEPPRVRYEAKDRLGDGTILARYGIEGVLGQGSFGVTYLARDLALKHQVAIKEYLPNEFAFRGEDLSVQPRSDAARERYEWGRERFLMEAQTLARFRHPNIVRVLAYFEANNTAYLVMDYESGESLKTVLDRRETLGEAELLGLLMPLLDGLCVLHEAGFVHRDIKPDNIILRKDGSPALLDFGSARSPGGPDAALLTALLTPGYAPHEQYYSESDNQGPWTDIYALSAVLYRALSGQRPAESTRRARSALYGQPDPLVPAREIGKGRYSEAFLAAVDLGLKILEKQRPQDVKRWAALFPPLPGAPADKGGAASGQAASPSADARALQPPTPAPTPEKQTPAPRAEDREPPARAVLAPEDTELRFKASRIDADGDPGRLREVLVLSLDEEQGRLRTEELLRWGCPKVEAFRSTALAMERLEARRPDCILCDADANAGLAIAFLDKVSRTLPAPRPALVLVSPRLSDALALDAVAAGVTMCLLRPCAPEEYSRSLFLLRELETVSEVEELEVKAARALLAAGKWPEAALAFEAVIAIDEEARHYGERGFREYFDMGCMDVLEGNLGRGMIAFRKAEKMLAVIADASKGLAEAKKGSGRGEGLDAAASRASEIAARFGRMETARRLFADILKRERGHANPFNTLGVKLRRLGDHAGAVRAYTLAVVLTPQDERVHFNLAKALAYKGEHKAALEQIQLALSLNPDFGRAAALYSRVTGASWEPPTGATGATGAAGAGRVGRGAQPSGPLSLLDE